jgi:catechol 2,3-dioxygenase
VNSAAAAFVAAGGYHHHLGFNVWRGEGVVPVPVGRVGLRQWTVVLEDPEEVAAVSGRIREAGIATEERGVAYDSQTEDRVKSSRNGAPVGQSVV